MMNPNDPNNKTIRIEEFPVELRFGRPDEKIGIINMPTESNTHFGRVKLFPTIETEEIPSRVDQDKRKDIKREIQVMKISMECSAKKNKKFGITLPINRGLRRTNDAKVHLLLEMTNERKMLTVADDYTDARMVIKGKEENLHDEAIQRQKRMMDQRRKNSTEYENHRDPDFKEKDEDDSD